MQAKKGSGQVAQDPLPKSYQPVTQRATQRVPSGLRTLPGRQMQADLSALRENLEVHLAVTSACVVRKRKCRPCALTQSGTSSWPSPRGRGVRSGGCPHHRAWCYRQRWSSFLPARRKWGSRQASGCRYLRWFVRPRRRRQAQTRRICPACLRGDGDVTSDECVR